MIKSLGMVLIAAAAIAFLVPRLHVNLPEGVCQSYQLTYWEVCYCWPVLLFRSFPIKRSDKLTSGLVGTLPLLIQYGSN